MVNSNNVSEKLMAPANGNGQDTRAWLESTGLIKPQGIYSRMVDNVLKEVNDDLTSGFKHRSERACERLKLQVEMASNYIKKMRSLADTRPEIWDGRNQDEISAVLEAEIEQAQEAIHTVLINLKLSGFKHHYLEAKRLADGQNDEVSRFQSAEFRTCDYDPDSMAESYLIEGLIPKARLTMLYGLSGVGKTHLSVDIANSVRLGNRLDYNLWTPFEGEAVEHGGFVINESGPVWYITADRQPVEIYQRYVNLCQARGVDWKDPSTSISVFDYRAMGCPDFAQERGREALIQYYEQSSNQPVLIIVDALYSILNGLELKDSRAGDKLAGINYIIAQTGVPWLMLHHPTKSGQEEAGAATIKQAVDRMYKVSQVNPGVLQVEADKVNGERFNFYLRADWKSKEFSICPKPTSIDLDATKRALNAAKQGKAKQGKSELAANVRMAQMLLSAGISDHNYGTNEELVNALAQALTLTDKSARAKFYEIKRKKWIIQEDGIFKPGPGLPKAIAMELAKDES